MSNPITKIELTGFRGATEPFELDIDPQKDLTMLFGENGSGKSTILDAMDVICNGTIGCLGGVSVGRSPGQYLCALGCQAATLQVTVHSQADSWTGTMSGNAISVAGNAVIPTVSILRRNKILDLVLAQPRERYQALQQFIDIATVERSEAALKQKRDETSSAINTLISDKTRMSNQLDNLWEAEGRPGPGGTSMEWAGSKVNTSIAALNDQLSRFRAVVNAIAASTTARSSFKSRADAHSVLKEQMDRVDQQIADAPNVNAATAVQLLASLEKAKAYIEVEQALDQCPTCLRPIEHAQLLATVNDEFTQLSALKALSDRKQDIQRQLDVADTLLQEAKAEVVSTLRKVAEVTEAGDIPEVVALNIAWPAWDQATEDMDSLVSIGIQLESVQAPLEQQRDDAQRDVSQFNSIKEWWNGIKEANDKMAELDRVLTGLRRAFDIVHEKRVQFTQGILDGIRQEADRLFQTLHPDENIGLEELKMEEGRQGSVSQSGVFNGHTDIPPQAIFSESHLDTLGFCVWLALAKRESPETTILLIDDIFSSVDAAHLSRVIDLLSTEAPNFLQVIVATHYRLWWDRCQNAQGIQRVHLGRWCATNGIAAQNMPLVTEQLRQRVAEPVLDRQAVSSKAGILLESILDDLTLHYECKLSRNQLNQYTLGALLNGSSKLFSRHTLTVQTNINWNADGQPENLQDTNAKTAYDRVNAMQFIRNQVGCHFNAPGMDIPDDDVRDFGTATIELVNALTCPNCGALATKTAVDGTYLRCTCSRRAVRMTPVAIT